MFDIQIQAENHLDELLSKIHKTLSQTVMINEEARDLTPTEEALMSQLDENTFLYQSLIKILAIDSYVESITLDAKKFNQLLSSLSALFQKMQKFSQALKQNADKNKLIDIYHGAHENMIECIEICEQRRSKARQTDEPQLQRLKEQNFELKRKLSQNDQQVINLEHKLTQLLKEHTLTEQSSYGSGTIMELRQELAFKESQIERMNEEFSYEIEKYNTVYEAMKKELQELRGYQNIDLIEQIEILQTEIVRLREENQRDQMIIRQLRTDIAVTGPSYESSRFNTRQYSRYNY